MCCVSVLPPAPLVICSYILLRRRCENRHRRVSNSRVSFEGSLKIHSCTVACYHRYFYLPVSSSSSSCSVSSIFPMFWLSPFTKPLWLPPSAMKTVAWALLVSAFVLEASALLLASDCSDALDAPAWGSSATVSSDSMSVEPPLYQPGRRFESLSASSTLNRTGQSCGPVKVFSSTGRMLLKARRPMDQPLGPVCGGHLAVSAK